MKEVLPRLRLYLLGSLLLLFFVVGIQSVFAQDCLSGSESISGLCIPEAPVCEPHRLEGLFKVMGILFGYGGLIGLALFVIIGIIFLIIRKNVKKADVYRNYLLYSAGFVIFCLFLLNVWHFIEGNFTSC